MIIGNSKIKPQAMDRKPLRVAMYERKVYFPYHESL